MKLASAYLGDVALARSGDKGASANVGLIARTPAIYHWLCEHWTAPRVGAYFASLGVDPQRVVRYELPNLHALNFVLPGVLDGGGSRSLRIDSQGKSLGQALLLARIEIDPELLAEAARATEAHGALMARN